MGRTDKVCAFTGHRPNKLPRRYDKTYTMPLCYFLYPLRYTPGEQPTSLENTLMK